MHTYTSPHLAASVLEATVGKLRLELTKARTQHWRGASGAVFKYTRPERQLRLGVALALIRFAALELGVYPADGFQGDTSLLTALEDDLLESGDLVRSEAAGRVVEKHWEIYDALNPPSRSLP